VNPYRGPVQHLIAGAFAALGAHPSAAMAVCGGAPQFASLYVGDLHPDVTEAMLYEIFNSVGPVGSIRVCRDSITRKSLGYGYINFHAVADAERALDTLNYSSIKGRACRIMWSQRDPSLRKSGVGNIFVKNLDRSIDNKALYDTFSLFGNILSCKVASDGQGKSKGYGFVHYETEEAAKQAIERVNGMQIGEKTVEVHPFQKRLERDKPEGPAFTNLYIRGFPNDWDEEQLKGQFGQFGSITSSCILEDNQGRGKFAFVNYENPEDAQSAIDALHKKDWRTDEEKSAAEGKEEELDGDGHPKHLMYVGKAQSKRERAAQLRKDKPQPEEANKAGVNLYVKNLDESTDDVSLRELFEPFGKVASAVAMRDDRGVCKGFGFVCFALPDEATKAVTEMHLKVVKGKPLYVGLAEKREARQERLRQRYATNGPMSFGGGKGGKGGGFDGGKGGGFDGSGGKGFSGAKGGQQAMQNMQSMQGQMFGSGQAPGMPPFPMMGGAMMYPGMPQLMGPRGPGGQMMGARFPMPMMGMMGCKGGPQAGQPPMMGMMGGMGGKGGLFGGPMGAMGGKGMGMMRPMGMLPGQTGPMAAGGARPPAGQQPPQPPQQQQQQQQQPQPGVAQQPPVAGLPGAPQGKTLTAAALAAAPPQLQKQMLGERLFPLISKSQPELAGKITGMMLEMDNFELLGLLDSEAQLQLKVAEALRVLDSTK